MKPNQNRRQFLKTGAATAATASSLPWTAKSYARIGGANDRLGVGLIGAGGMGSGHATTIAKLAGPNNLNPIAVAGDQRDPRVTISNNAVLVSFVGPYDSLSGLEGLYV